MPLNILFLTQVLPWPLDAGPKSRAYYVLRALAREHRITLLSFVRASDSAAAVEHLRQVCDRVETVPMVRSRARDGWFLARSLAGPTPFVIERDRVDAMDRAIRTLVAETPFDAVHADQLWMANYALRACAAHAPGARPFSVLDQHNATWRIFDRLASGEPNPLKRRLLALESRKLARYEIETCRRFDAVTWVTQEDVDEMAAAANGLPVPNAGVIPICIDAAAEPPLDRAAHPRRLTFLGGLHYPPNAQGALWFAREVFPQVLAAVPDAKLTVIGRDPPAALHALGLPPGSLDVTGYVDDPLPYLRESAAFLVPLLAGGGMRVKILDGWRWGLPIISTSVGAEGIRYVGGRDLLVADDAESFAGAAVGLLTNPEMRECLGSAGRCWVEQAYHWPVVYQRWNELYDAARAPQANTVQAAPGQARTGQAHAPQRGAV